jgi:hypothetical protein
MAIGNKQLLGMGESSMKPTIQLPPTVLVIDLLLSEDEAFIRNLILDLMDNRKMEWSLE